MNYIYIYLCLKNKAQRVVSFDNVKSAFEFAESEMDDHWTQSIKIIFKIRLDF